MPFDSSESQSADNPPHWHADDIKAYLHSHFYTLSQLSTVTNLPPEVLQEWADAGCIPQHSYTVTASLSFHNHVLGTTEFPAQTERFFAQSTTDSCKKAERLLAETGDLHAVRLRLRSDFYTEFRSAILQVPFAKIAWSSCFQGHPHFDEPALIHVLKQQWEHVLDGSYGVCLKSVNALHIVRKQAALSAIDWYTDHERKAAQDLTEEDSAALLRAVQTYCQITMPLAPHERHLGTHQKVVRVMAHYRLIPPCAHSGSEAELLGDVLHVPHQSAPVVLTASAAQG